MTESELKALAADNGYTTITTTFSLAIAGFDSFDEAQRFATDNNLELATFERRDGERIYRVKEYAITAPLSLRLYYDVQGGHMTYGPDDDFWDNERNVLCEALADSESIDEFRCILENRAQVESAIRHLKPNEFLIDYGDDHFEVKDDLTTSLHYDTQRVIIAAFPAI